MTVFNGVPPAGIDVLDDGETIIVANAFHIPAGTVGYPKIAGMKLYVPPAKLAQLPATVTMMMWNGIEIGDPPLQSKVVSKGAGGWLSAMWDVPYTLPTNSPVYLGYTWGTLAAPGPKYMSANSTDEGPVIGPDGIIRLSQATPNPGWRRGLFRYGSMAETAGTNGIYGVDPILEGDGPEGVLATPALTIVSTSPESASGGDGTITASWPAIPGAGSYEAGIAPGSNQVTGFVSKGAVTSPYTWTNLEAGTYTVAVRALPPA